MHALIADRQLTGDYGTVAVGEEFEVDTLEADNLVARGLARWPTEPKRRAEPEAEPLALKALRAAVLAADTRISTKREREVCRQQNRR
jgi:hypothetical protein